MKILGRIGILAMALGSLSGCYVDPGYSYVRGGGGGAYVGDPEPEYVAPANYYGPAYGDYGYYGGGFGASTIWIDDGYGHRYRRGGPYPRYGDHDRDHGGRDNWRGGDRGHGDDNHSRGGWAGRPPGGGGDQHGGSRPGTGGRPSSGGHGPSGGHSPSSGGARPSSSHGSGSHGGNRNDH